MRFRLTILLALLNAAVFFSIWMLEREPAKSDDSESRLTDFTALEVYGKTLEKPRIIQLENNRWRITSPIEWPANFFAINRIRSQLEFLDRQTSFSVSEIEKHSQTLADFGLDDPAFTFKYGGKSGMHTLKIGNLTPIGNRMYMLDERAQKIIVVDKELVENLAVDIERLRSQDVFEIPRFEINAISVRIPQGDNIGEQGAKFRRVGLVRDGENWSFETPIAAPANRMEVETLINTLTSVSAKSFVAESAAATGFDISAFPMTVTLSGTNRRQVLLLGNPVAGTDQIYAKLEDNPTVFTLDAAIFKDFKDLQTSLRDKNFMAFNPSGAEGLDVSDGRETVRLRNLKNGSWEVSSGSEGPNAQLADSAIIASSLSALSSLGARAFVSDAPGENLSPYGLDKPSLKVSLLMDGKTRTLLLGKAYKLGAAELLYAMVEGEPSVYGVAPGIARTLPADALHYKSRLLEAIPEKGELKGFSLSDALTGEVIYSVAAADGESIEAQLAKISPERRRGMASIIADYSKKFVVQRFVKNSFSEDGAQTGGKILPWAWKLETVVQLPGTGKSIEEKHVFLFAQRSGGTTQYGGSPAKNATFEIPVRLMEALQEFTSAALVKSISSPAPQAPDPKK